MVNSLVKKTMPFEGLSLGLFKFTERKDDAAELAGKQTAAGTRGAEGTFKSTDFWIFLGISWVNIRKSQKKTKGESLI